MSELSNEATAINALRFWFEASPMYPLGFVRFTDAVAHYRTGSFLDQLGRALRPIAQSKVKAAFVALATKHGTNYPPKLEFFDALAKEAGTATVSEVAAATAKDISDKVGEIANFSGKTLVIVAAVGLVVWILLSLPKGAKLASSS